MRLIAFLRDGEWTSAYATPLLAAIMRPVHEHDCAYLIPATIPHPKVTHCDGLRHKIGMFSWSRGPVSLPDVTPVARIRFAVLIARRVHKDPVFRDWADAWLEGEDRTRASALRTMTHPSCDPGYVAHWALMAAAFSPDLTLPAQTAALAAAYVCPAGTMDFASIAEEAIC